MNSHKRNSQIKIYDSDATPIPVIALFEQIIKSTALISVLVKKDLTVRYKRSIIGIWWSLLNPLLTTVILFYIFNTAFKGKIANGEFFIPYILSGVLVITFFNQSLTMITDSISSNANIFTKINVRPELFAVAASISATINFIFGLVPLIIVSILTGVQIGWSALALVYVLICMMFTVVGLGLLAAISYIFFEDFRSIIQLIVTVLGYMTPVFYPISVLGPHTRPIIEANPLTSILSIFRHYVGNLEKCDWTNWLYSGCFSVGVFILGICVFEKLWPKAVTRL